MMVERKTNLNHSLNLRKINLNISQLYKLIGYRLIIPYYTLLNLQAFKNFNVPKRMNFLDVSNRFRRLVASAKVLI